MSQILLKNYRFTWSRFEKCLLVEGARLLPFFANAFVA